MLRQTNSDCATPDETEKEKRDRCKKRIIKDLEDYTNDKGQIFLADDKDALDEVIDEIIRREKS